VKRNAEQRKPEVARWILRFIDEADFAHAEAARLNRLAAHHLPVVGSCQSMKS
jgi:hypothetical protein